MTAVEGQRKSTDGLEVHMLSYIRKRFRMGGESWSENGPPYGPSFCKRDFRQRIERRVLLRPFKAVARKNDVGISRGKICREA